MKTNPCCFAFIMFLLIFGACSKDDEIQTEIPEVKSYPEGSIDTTLSMGSTILGFDAKYSVYLPPGYNTSTMEYPVLYLLNGMEGSHRSWPGLGVASNMDAKIDNESIKPMVVVMPHGYDAFYCNNAFGDGGLMYEDFLIQEFFPFIEANYRVKTTKNNTAIAGLSMGGFGCTFLAFKFPDKFGSSYSMSGAFVIQSGDNNLENIINAKTPEELSDLPGYTMECGTEDFLVYSTNESIDAFLTNKGITHTFVERPGGHTSTFWAECLPKALEFVSGYFD